MTFDTQAPSSNSPATRRIGERLRRVVLAGSLVTAGFVLGAGTIAAAAAGGGMAWHGGFGHGARIGFIQHAVRGALEDVGATTAQEDKIHDIIAATYTDLDKGGADREAMRKQVMDLMKAPTLDRAALEKLRAEKIGEIDAKSKKIVDALVAAAGELTTDQRTKLVQNAEERMSHGGWGGWHHGGRMGAPDDNDDNRPRDRGDHG